MSAITAVAASLMWRSSRVVFSMNVPTLATSPINADFSPLYPKYVESSDRVRYQKRVVVLTNRGCYSATNEFVSIMKYAPGVTVMGDKTGGGSGLPFSSELPNGWSIRFSASPMFNAEKEHIEFGVEPDIFVEMQKSDKEKNIDTMIELARETIRLQ